jgi:hypothetical protein
MVAPSTVAIQTDQLGDFSNVHNFVKNSFGAQFKAHVVANRAVRHLRLKEFGNNKNQRKVVQGRVEGVLLSPNMAIRLGRANISL